MKSVSIKLLFFPVLQSQHCKLLIRNIQVQILWLLNLGICKCADCQDASESIPFIVHKSKYCKCTCWQAYNFSQHLPQKGGEIESTRNSATVRSLRMRRRRLLQQVYRRQSPSQQQEESVDEFLKKNRCNTLMATAVCGCVGIDTDNASLTVDESSPDFCTFLWQCISSLCYGVVCRCWCQCCGMCAVARQDRQLEQVKSIPMDYITFEPFDAYSAKLQELRTRKVKSFWEHLKNMSKLSYKLLQILAWSIVVLAVIAILRVERNFTVVNLAVCI